MDWLRRWDAQQEGYVPEREARFTAMFDALADLLPTPFVVLDLACGPGSISQRLLARFADAQALAVDIDPLMVAIGRGALGTVDGRLRWIEADLASPEWPVALGRTQVDAVLSTTALHWLEPEPLGRLYHDLARLLRPGGLPPQRRPHGLRSSVADLRAPEPAGPRRAVGGRRLRRTRDRNGGAVVRRADSGAGIRAAADRAGRSVSPASSGRSHRLASTSTWQRSATPASARWGPSGRCSPVALCWLCVSDSKPRRLG